MKNRVLLILLVGIAFTMSTCSTAKLPGDTLKFIENKWFHAHEEDVDQIRVYHTSEYDYKPSRGRETFSLLPDGKLEIVPLSPNDEPKTYKGSWKIDKALLLLTFNEKTLQYEIIDIQTNTLKLKSR